MRKAKRILSAAMTLMLMAVLPVSAFAQEYNIDQGSITVSAKSDGNQYVTQVGGKQDELQTSETVITQTDSGKATTNTVTISAETEKTARVTLDGVNIDVSEEGAAAVHTLGEGNVTVELDNASTLKSGNDQAGLWKNNKGDLTITDSNTTAGSLDVTGGGGGAGIGGCSSSNHGENIKITGGKITARGGDGGAGIGGGGGAMGEGNTIIISGGEVYAQGGADGAGIGGGIEGGKGVNITITGGKVTAIGGRDTSNIHGGSGIGGGSSGSGMNISIEGGTVIAIGGGYGAGIGGDNRTNGDYEYMNTSISGDALVSVKGGSTGPAIGNSGEAEFTPDTSKLSSNGRICYYASDAVIGEDRPWKAIHTGECIPETDAAVDATCTSTGLTEGSHCSIGGDTIVAQTEIPMLEHNIVVDAEAVEPTCTSTGLTEAHHCTTCTTQTVEQEEIPMLEHNIVILEAVAPTYTSEGLTAGQYCTTCDTQTIRQEIIPKLEKPALYRVTDRIGRDIDYKSERREGVLTITVDADTAVLIGTLSGINELGEQGVGKITLVTRGAASTFTLAGLLEKGSPGNIYELTHDGEAVTFTLGVESLDISGILEKE